MPPTATCTADAPTVPHDAQYMCVVDNAPRSTTPSAQGEVTESAPSHGTTAYREMACRMTTGVPLPCHVCHVCHAHEYIARSCSRDTWLQDPAVRTFAQTTARHARPRDGKSDGRRHAVSFLHRAGLYTSYIYTSYLSATRRGVCMCYGSIRRDLSAFQQTGCSWY